MCILSVFTTWHPIGYKKYGKEFINNYLYNWPEQVHLTIYAEDHEPDSFNADNITVLDQRTTLPELKAWQERHKDNPHANGWNKDETRKSFLWDASRFANKTFAVWHFAKHTNADVMIWCDGDVRTHTPIPAEFLHSIAPDENQLATYLGRQIWPECGWMMFNKHHPQFKDFMEYWENIYTSDDIFNYTEYHDSFIFGEIINEFKKRGVKFRNLGSDNQSGHIFINSELGAYMDHLKGFRKEVGKSLLGDITKKFKHHDLKWWQGMQDVTKQEIRAEKLKKPHEYDAQELKSKAKPK